MKSIIILCCLVAAVIGEEYTDMYDNIDYKEIIENDKLRMGYLNCLDDKGPCTPEGKKLKEILPDALETECSKCTPKQKEATEEIIKNLVEQHPDEWKRLTAKYDPSGNYLKKYEEEAKKRNIKLPN